jgi:glycosyltransferase involved in cell wall biosynthesis
MEVPWILVLCHEFPPLGGGAGKNLFLLCRELTRLGYRVKVCTCDPGIEKRGTFDFEVTYLAVGRKNRFETNFLSMGTFIAGAILRARFFPRSARFFPRSARFLQGGRPALVFSVLGIPAGIAGSLIAGFARVPHVVWYHGSDIHAGQARGPGLWQRIILRQIWKRTAVNFFVSEGLMKMAKTLGDPKRASILPACPSPEILAYPTEGGLPPAERYFLFLGRFDSVKNPLLPLKAMVILKTKAMTKAKTMTLANGKVTRRLRMVGSGVLGPKVRDFIRDQDLSDEVILEGAASYSEVPELLRSAYALLLPSRIEGFNTTLLEAAHFRVPAIASDTEGIRDFVRQGETGLLFKENDEEALADAMQTLMADLLLREELGMHASKAAAPFVPAQVTATFLAALTHLLPNYARPIPSQPIPAPEGV